MKVNAERPASRQKRLVSRLRYLCYLVSIGDTELPSMTYEGWVKMWNDHAARWTRWQYADEAMRDIRERLEHAGTNEIMRRDINSICNRYWKLSANEKAHLPPDGAGGTEKR